jgi:hypothetical protein
LFSLCIIETVVEEEKITVYTSISILCVCWLSVVFQILSNFEKILFFFHFIFCVAVLCAVLWCKGEV